MERVSTFVFLLALGLSQTGGEALGKQGLEYMAQTLDSTVPQHLYGQEKRCIFLTLPQQYEDPDAVFWNVNRAKLVRYYPPEGSEPEVVTSRVEFNKTTYSLNLLNLQKNHSGVYLVEIRLPKDKIVYEFNLTVQEAAQHPNLTVVSRTSSSDSCNVTLACGIGDHSQTVTCYRNVCEGGIDDHKLKVNFDDRRIICNHSNEVSWSNATMEIDSLCPETAQHPNLTVVSRTSSNDSCNVTLTCRIGDHSQTVTCNRTGCEGGIDDRKLKVYFEDRRIICSNEVSWSNATMEIDSLCPGESSTLNDDSVTVIILGVALVALVVTAVYYASRRCSSTMLNCFKNREEGKVTWTNGQKVTLPLSDGSSAPSVSNVSTNLLNKQDPDPEGEN